MSEEFQNAVTTKPVKLRQGNILKNTTKPRVEFMIISIIYTDLLPRISYTLAMSNSNAERHI